MPTQPTNLVEAVKAALESLRGTNYPRPDYLFEFSANLQSGFRIPMRSVVVDNGTARWVYVASAGRFVPPYTWGALLELAATTQAQIKFLVPGGYTQGAIIAGETVIAKFFSDMPAIAIVPGISSTPTAPSVDVSDRAGRLLGIIASITAAVDVSDRAGRLLGVVASITAAVDISDRAGRLLGQISAAAGALFDVSDRAGRLVGVIASITAAVDVSDRAGRLLGVVASITAAVDVSDRAGRLVGIVYGSLGQLTQKAASVLAVATDVSLVVQQSPMDAQAAVLGITATAAVNTASTATLPAPAAGLFHYITHIELVKLYSVVGVAAGAGVIVTSTNLPGNPAWTTEQLASAAGTAVKVIFEEPAESIKSSVAATATTFVAPQQLQTIWRWNIRYYTAP